MAAVVTPTSVRSDIARYGRVPEALITLDHPQTGLAIRVFASLDRFRNRDTGKAWPKRETVAEYLGISVASVDRAINILVEHDFLVVERQGQHLPNVYTLVFPLPSESSPVMALDDSESSRVMSQTPSESSPVTTPYKNESHKERTRGRDTPSVPPVRSLRPDQVMFTTLAEACSLDIDKLTKRERGRLNEAGKDLLNVGATLDEVRRRAKAYPRVFPNCILTPQALSGNWSKLAEGSSVVSPNRPPLIADLLADEPPRNRAAGLPAIRAAKAHLMGA